MNKIIDLRELTDSNLDNSIAFLKKEVVSNQEVLDILLKEKSLRLEKPNLYA